MDDSGTDGAIVDRLSVAAEKLAVPAGVESVGDLSPRKRRNSAN